MTKPKLIDAHAGWIIEQLSMLSEQTNGFKSFDRHGVGTFNWPLSTTLIYTEDTLTIGAGLVKLYSDRSTKCALKELTDKMMDRAVPIDRFFYLTHFLGHCVIEELRPELDKADVQDVAFMETSNLFFNMVLCRHYFNIDHITPAMAKELAVCIYDSSRVELLKGVKYTSLDRMNLASDMLEVVQAKQIQFTFN